MRNNYFAKLVRYMKNVYHVDCGLNKLSDGRVNPTYSTGRVMSEPIITEKLSYFLFVVPHITFYIKNAI